MSQESNRNGAGLAIAGAIALLMLPVAASAQTLCNGSISGTHDDVIVNGVSCTIEPGTLVRGSVMVTSGGTLTANGAQINGSVIGSGAEDMTLDLGTMVNGGVLADSSGTVHVFDAMVLGDLSVVNSIDVVIHPTALCDDPAPGAPPANNVSSVKIQSSGMVRLTNACVGSVESAESDALSLTDSKVFPGSVTLSKGNGGLTIIGSTVEGEVKVSETTGAVSADAGTTIDGAVSVEKGTGAVTLAGTTLAAGDLNVVEQEGDVTLDGMAQTTSLSDLKVEKSWNVTLKNVETDSDTTLVNNRDISIEYSTLGSDAAIASNGAVTLRGNGFSLEDVIVSGNGGPVVVAENSHFNISLIQNNDVTFRDNSFTDADISKNTGGVSITNNTGEVLKCFDNDPPPDPPQPGLENTITELADGQCADF